MRVRPRRAGVRRPAAAGAERRDGGHVWLGEASLRLGRPDEAWSLAGRGLECCRAYAQRGEQAWALRLVGEIHAHRQPPEAEPAEAAYREALALAEALGMRPLQAH